MGVVLAASEPGLLNVSGLPKMNAEINALVRRLRDGLEERPVVVSSGFRAIDSLLPDGGIRRGSLVEWLLPCGGEASLVSAGSFEAASGGITLACAVAVRGLHSSAVHPEVRRQAAGDHSAVDNSAVRQVVIVVDRQGRFHPPAVFPWMGLYSLTGGHEYRCDRSGCRLVVVRPSTDDDETWAIDQSLRCSGVKAVVAWPRRIHPTAMRRWQLAARVSGSVGLIARPISHRREPSWAHVRLMVSPVPGGAGSVAGRGVAGMRGFRVSMVAGPIDFEERSATVALEMQSGIEIRNGIQHESRSQSESSQSESSNKSSKNRGSIREQFQCHAS